tara:strand:- start:2447 stop:2647 length:201 start_codon:yes stop_codon:yes gene_type:complete
MKVTATDLSAFPLVSHTYCSLEAFATVADRFDPELTILEIDTEDGTMPVISLDLNNVLRVQLAEFV